MNTDLANANASGVVGSSPTTEDTTLTNFDKLVKEKGVNPCVLATLTASLLNGSPDPVKVSEETHPVFYHGTKNDEMYHFVPKKGFGVQKDGSKIHYFDYEASFHNRSKDFYDQDIQAAIDANDIHRLSNLLVAAFSDLVLDGNSDMTSYMYLMDKSRFALSDAVKEMIGDLAKDGGVALGLVTELVATSSNAEDLFKRAVLSREQMSDLEGLEALNESYIRKVYAAVTPVVETKGILLNNGVDISQGWGKKLAEKVPTMDSLVNLDFNTLRGIVSPSSSTETNTSSLYDLKAPVGQELIAYQMHAGMLGLPAQNTTVPPIRGYILENGLHPEIAYKMEQSGNEDLTAVDDKDIYSSAQSILESFGNPDTNKPTTPNPDTNKPNTPNPDTNKPNTPNPDTNKPSTPNPDTNKPGDGNVQQKIKEYEAKVEKKRKEAERDNFLKRKLMDTRGSALKDKRKGIAPAKRWKSSVGRVTSAKRTVGAFKGSLGKGVAKAAAGSALKGGLMAGGGAALTGAGAGAGMAATAASGLAAMAGPAAVALALAPVIKDLAASTERRMDEDMDSAVAEREKISAEVSDLLESLKNATGNTGEDLKDAQNRAEALLNKVRNPEALKLSQAQGMGLQKQLHALETRFSPTSMSSRVPYTSDEELVANVDSGKALAAVALFIDPENPIYTPERPMLQTPRYVNLMGASQPFQTFTKRTTSEKESKSFLTSVSSSGFSTANKTVGTKSNSIGAGVNIIVAGAKGKRSSSTQNTTESSAQQVDSKERKEEKTKTATQAIVQEYTTIPMATFRLREGGLALAPYASYRLQRITNDKDSNNKTIMDEVTKEATRRHKAREFIRNFGSHVPIGVQTLGGCFIRTMKITTISDTSLSTLYATATARLTATNSEASKTTTTATARQGILGLGGSVTSSSGHSNARSSGTTIDVSQSDGSGTGATSTNSTFESDVTCFGPSAATQDDLYLQLMSNNKTWTVIDRGEADSYFAIWDLVDYLGQGGLLQVECKLLREVWEEMAISNSISFDGNYESNMLLSIVMRNYDEKLKLYNFVQSLIYCLVPESGFQYDSDLAKNFEQILTKSIEKLKKEKIVDPNKLIEAGVESIQEDDSSFKLKFELVDGNEGYDLATEILNETSTNDWNNYFTYYSDTYAASIINKGKPSFLYDVCTVCVTSENKKNWNLVKKIIDSNVNLDKYLNYKDEESGNHCLHLIVESNDFDLVRSAHVKCTSIAKIKNKGVRNGGQTQTIVYAIEPKTPKEIAQKYENISSYSFPENPHFNASEMWLVDEKNNVYFLADDKKSWTRYGDLKIKFICNSNKGEYVWGIDMYGKIHYLHREESTEWQKIEPSPTNIIENIAVSANGSHVYAVDVDGNVLKGVLSTENKWEFQIDDSSVNFRLKSVSINEDGSKIYGINRANLKCLLKSSTGWIEHESITTGSERISVSPNGELLYCTDYMGGVHKYSLGGNWRPVEFSENVVVRHVVVDNGDNVWYLSQNGALWYQKQGNKLEKISTESSFKQISSCDSSVKGYVPLAGNHIWLVGGEEMNKLFHLSRSDSYKKQEIILPSGCDRISYITSNPNGDVWIVSSDHKLFYRPKDSNTWHYLRGNMEGPIAAGKNGGFAWIAQDQSDSKTYIYYYQNGGETLKHEIGSNPVSLAIDDNETCICYTAANGELWYASTESNEWKNSGVYLNVFSLTKDLTPLGSKSLIPYYEADFSQDYTGDYELDDATIEQAPGVEFNALRIDSGKRAKLPVNINPSIMEDCTIVVGAYLETTGSDIEILVSSDDGSGHDRAIITKDSSGSMSMRADAVSPSYSESKPPPLQEWFHVTAVFRHEKESFFYFNGEKAPLSPVDSSGSGNDYLVVGGGPISGDYHCDGWVKEVKIYNWALSDVYVEVLSRKFHSQVSKTMVPLNILNPTHEVDFSQDGTGSYELIGDATIESGAPNGVSRALRVNSSGSYAKLPININPSVMPNCTIVVGAYLESIVTGKGGWLISSDDGNLDRSIVLHYSDLKGMGICTGSSTGLCYTEETNAPEKQWFHIVAVIRQGKQSFFYFNGEKAPLKPVANNGSGVNYIAVGNNPKYDSHYCDCWVKEVKIYNWGLGDKDAQALSEEFHSQFSQLIERKDRIAILNRPLEISGNTASNYQTTSLSNSDEDWQTLQSASMTSDGKHLWGIKADGNVYYRAGVKDDQGEDHSWDEIPFDETMAKVSVS